MSWSRLNRVPRQEVGGDCLGAAMLTDGLRLAQAIVPFKTISARSFLRV